MMTVNNSPDKRYINSNINANSGAKKAVAAGGGIAVVGSPSITTAEGGYSPGLPKNNNSNVTNMVGESNNNNFATSNQPGANNTN